MSDYLVQPSNLPTLRQRLALRALRLVGWTLHYKPLPGPHGIVVVYPHTSNWDFPIGLVAKWALDLDFRWLAKDSLFRGLMGRIMRYWGGIAIDRSAPMGATRQIAQNMLAEEWCWVAITPEGTRGYRPHWKSGFYHLARTANVPLLLVSFDYGKKELRLVDTLMPSGDIERDMEAVRAVYKDVQALHPEDAAPIKLSPRDSEAPRREQA